MPETPEDVLRVEVIDSYGVRQTHDVLKWEVGDNGDLVLIGAGYYVAFYRDGSYSSFTVRKADAS